MSNLVTCPGQNQGGGGNNPQITCDTIAVVSPDNSIIISKGVINGVCTIILKVNPSVVGGSTGISTEDTSAIQLIGDGINTALKALLKLSTNPLNILTIDSEGLLALAPAASAETPNTKTDSSTVLITLSGAANRNIRADVKISQVAGNVLVANSDGLYVPTPASSGLSSVVPSTTATVTLSGQGTSLQPLAAVVRISSTTGNDIEVKSDGLYHKTRVHYSLISTDLEVDGITWINTDLAGKSLSIWLLSLGRFIYESMGEFTLSPGGGFVITVPGFNASTDKIEVFVKS